MEKGFRMPTRALGLERLLLALFVASGFAGLIYQAIWSHYLGLTLGHAAYSQTLVLGIFMGGMSLGAWLVSKRGVRWRRLILAYAVVEIVVGLAGLAFHPVFLAYTGLSQETIYPAMDSVAAVRAWQWGSAALLIAPQSILLGMTFPLMSGGYLRIAPRADGEILGGLYFSNSIGAAFGALFATFVLLPWVGMPGAIVCAGLVNLAVGLLAWRVSRRADAQPDPAPAAPGAGPGTQGLVSDSPAIAAQAAPVRTARPMFFRTLLLVACLTGATSFVYEIAWVRMLNQVLGTTVHSFELMLSAFILGLAFGGLWVRRRSSRIGDAVSTAGWAQLWMGLAALVSLPLFAQSFHWVGWLMGYLPRTDDGYTLFVLASGAISMLVMFPAAFFAGMTLPLITMAMLRNGSGEAGIGRVYAINTLGAILGVVVAVHVLIPTIGLQLSVTLAALVDVVLGVVLIRWFAAGERSPRTLPVGLVAVLVVLGISLVLGRADPRVLASGVFRTGSTTVGEGATVPYLKDGKTSTVSVIMSGNWRSIVTNGKPDAALTMGLEDKPADDEITMLMLGSLPLALHPEPEEIGVIGWGSGLTTHTLLGSDKVGRVDSIEIEPAMVQGSRLMYPRVLRAFEDPRSQLHIDDARTFFSTGRKRFDVIVSEPSNPWVSGVGSLFTRQFYGFLGNHLEADGVLIQWVHIYELDNALLATMLAAIGEEFPYVDLYQANQGDLILAASKKPLPAPVYPASPGSMLAREMKRVGLGSAADFEVRRLGDRRILDALVRMAGVGPYDDFYPVVSLNAPRARFKNLAAEWVLRLESSGLPVLEATAGLRPVPADAVLTDVEDGLSIPLALEARRARAAVLGHESPKQIKEQGLEDAVEDLLELSASDIALSDEGKWLAAAAKVAEATLAELTPQDSRGLWIDPSWFRSGSAPDSVRTVMQAYDATARRDYSAMQQTGLAALEALDPAIAPVLVREHMLVIARLGAIGQGDLEGSVAIEREFGRDVPGGGNAAYSFVRGFLLAWADQGEGDE
ncbi:MAG: fused MFS/spermidine synthase [Pseudomonadota bacterium]